ncbi:MAG: Mg-chelatase subunit ChlI [Thermodesulfobacterium sp.]|uniref:Mg-protoporphyrin IX chelatase n=1 Tax=Candidatus Thermodesulfobacterium syntrophicum TaxID=3060442 RepID=A0AAE3TFW4_9BACT|nr:Mg-chelatase subunit ChlI [Candidatus Thermodesulfobacterium syntrophicum]
MIFPFCAVVDQEEMKLGLILNVIDPSIGGVLIMGEKGTAKSTTVRALADLLPEIEVIKGCRFNCSPDGPFCLECLEKKEKGENLEVEKKKMEVVELPLGVTEDRVVGTIDVEYAITYGKRHFEPGLLAKANRNFLYIDEVNLLEDHIVDLLLDSAAMGINRVEREGISFFHPARFILVGSMNPEEGELRPQFLDRFGLCVQVRAITDKNLRKEVLKRKIEFDTDPEGFLKKWKNEQETLSQRIVQAKKNLSEVKVPEEIYKTVVDLTSQLNLDGHRGDIVLLKAAKAYAAFNKKDSVEKEDLKKVVLFSLRHRLKRLPFEEPEMEVKKLYELLSIL